MGSSLPASRAAQAARFRVGVGDRIAIGLEAALDIVALLFLPILTMAALGVAALATFAGVCAACLALLRDRTALLRLRFAAAMLALFLGWGGLSSLWSIDPLRSLEVTARLGGLAIAALCLIAAAQLIANPRRLLLCGLLGLVLTMMLALTEIATGGAVSGSLYDRHHFPVVLNRGAVALAILLMPIVATMIHLGRARFAIPLAVAMIATIYALAATIAKLMLPIGVVVAAGVLQSGRRIGQTAAVLSVLLVVTAPLTFAWLAGLPGMIEHADELKQSAGHRLAIWHFAGERIAERPILGWGLDASRAIPGGKEEFRPGQPWLPLHPHNAALQVWLELGAPGAILFASLLALLWRALDRAAWPPLFAAAAAGSGAAAMIAGLGTYDAWHEWWVGTLALMLFLICVMGSVCRDSPLARSEMRMAR